MPEASTDAARRLWDLWQQGRPELAEFLAAAGPLAPAELAAVLRVDQRQRWLLGERLPAEHYLAAYPDVAADEEAALDVVYAEVLLRQDQGEAIPRGEFVGRFPQFAEQLAVQLDFGRAMASTRRFPPPQSAGNGPAPDPQVAATKRMSAATAAAPPPPAPPPPPEGDEGRRVRCPHCHNPIHLLDQQSEDVLCPGCGSRFRLREARATATPAPMRLGKFQLLERVGLGAFGAVWRARDTELDRVVALKIPHTGLTISADELHRFEEEARKVAQLRHPGIVTVYEVCRLNGLPAIVSDFIDGVTLRDLIESRRLTFREAAALVASVAEALHHAHEKGLVHRDMKPANLMVELARGPSDRRDPDDLGWPWILDFGLALWDKAEIAMTLDGQIVGTPAYMSPEQAAGQGHRADRRSDVFSLGVMLYEMLTGELPFRGSYVMLLHQVRFEEPRPPRLVNDKIAHDLQTICLTAMAKEPGRRYQTAAALAADLRHFLAGEPILARPAGRVERWWRWCRRHPRDAALVGAILLLLVLLPLVTTPLAIAMAHQATVARQQEDEAKKQLAMNLELMKLGARDQQRLGTQYAHSGLLKEAEDAYRQAIDLWERLSAQQPDEPEYPYQLALRRNDLGDLLRHGDAPAAEDQYRRALDLLRPLTAAHRGEAAYAQGLARTYRNLGGLHHETNHFQKAETEFNEAIALLRSRVEGEAVTPALLDDLAHCEIARGNLLWDRDRLSEAETGYTEAIELLLRVTAQNSAPESRGELAMAYVNRASVRKKMVPRHDEKVGDDFQQALHHQEQLQAEFDKYPQYKYDLAVIYNQLSLFLEDTNRFAAAERENAKARAVAEELATKYPTVASYKGLLGVTLENRAWMLLDQEDKATLLLIGTPGARVVGELARLSALRRGLVEADRLLTDAVGLHRQNLKTNPRNPDYHRYLRSACKNLAETLLRQGDHEGAAEAAVLMARSFPDEAPEEERRKARRRAGAFLVRCAELAAQDPGLPGWVRWPLAQQYLALAARAPQAGQD